MAPLRGSRVGNRGAPVSSANGRNGVRDARDVLRRGGGTLGRSNGSSLVNSGNRRLNGAGREPASARILKTAHGLVTNKKAKGISTSQLRNRQQQQKSQSSGFSSSSVAPSSSGRAPSSSGRPPNKVGVGATIRKSVVINSNPMLQRILCVLLPMESSGRSVGDNHHPPVATTAPVTQHNNSSSAIASHHQTEPNGNAKNNHSNSTPIESPTKQGSASPDAFLHDAPSMKQSPMSYAAVTAGAGRFSPSNNTHKDRSSPVGDVNRNLDITRSPVSGVSKPETVTSTQYAAQTTDAPESSDFQEEEFDRVREWLEQDAAIGGNSTIHPVYENGSATVNAGAQLSGDLLSQGVFGSAKNTLEEKDPIGGAQMSDDRGDHHQTGCRQDEESLNINSTGDDVRIDMEEQPKDQASKRVLFDEAKNTVATKTHQHDSDDDWEDAASSDEEKSSHASSELDNLELPTTCHVLEAPNGCTVYLIGTAHFSKESQNDVKKVIRMKRPDCVVVELCSQRMHVLTLDEKFLLNNASHLSLSTIRETIRKMGALQGGFFLLLLQLTAQVTKKLKVATGGEFRVAYQESQRLRKNCQVFLGDREINVTLRRAWASLGVWQRIQIIWNLLSTSDDISMEDVERCKEKDMLEQLVGEMCADHPDLTRVLLHERDLYLCRSLFNVTLTSPIPRTVVAVVGIGHQKGIVDHWETAENIHLHELTIIPQAPLSVRVTGRIFKIGFWVGVGYVTYRFILPKTIKESVVRGVETGLKAGSDKILSLLK